MNQVIEFHAKVRCLMSNSNFDDNKTLEAIYSRESFVVDGFELIDSPIDSLDRLWNWRSWLVIDSGACRIVECPGSMKIIISNEKISGVTVDKLKLLPPGAWF